MTRYTLDMNEEQACMVSRALELYARLRCGQWDELIELCVPRSREDFCIKRDFLMPALMDARCIAFPELTKSRGHSYGVGSFEDADLAWEVYEVLRNKIAWTRHPEGGSGVNFDPPMSFRGSELATCSTREVSESDSTKIK